MILANIFPSIRSEWKRPPRFRVYVLLLCALLFLEFKTIRFLIHDLLGIRLGYAKYTDNDFVYPALIVLFIFLRTLHLAKPFSVGFRKIGFLKHVVVFSLFLLLSSVFRKTIS